MKTRVGVAGLAGVVLALAAWCVSEDAARAGNNNNGNFGSAVGGISIDASGVLQNASVEETGRLREARKQALAAAPAELDKPTEMRKISLRRLEAVLADCIKNSRPIPDEVTYLAGLTRIQYVFVYPEEQDIVIAGPGEGWAVDAGGNVVGSTSGRPILQLDDFLISFRALAGDVQQPITCSIDPTSEGIRRLQTFLKAQGGRIGSNPAATIKQIEESLGPQTITLSGVEPTTHFARVLVAADYRMKRLGMGFEEAPIAKLPSFLQMSGGGTGDLFPRWWMAPNYEALQATPERDAWELRGTGVKVMTEDAHFAETGERKTTGKVNPIAKKWADSMTDRYEELSLKLPIFAELRGLMDMAVVTALIVKEDLPSKANLDLGVLLDGTVTTRNFEAPKQTPTQASFLKKGSQYVISASGGVDLDPWKIVDEVATNEGLAKLKSKAAIDPTMSRWWWN